MEDDIMARTIKSCNFNGKIAATIFCMLNPGQIHFLEKGENLTLITNVEPSKLIYPEGWYYEDGWFRNRKTTDNECWYDIFMVDSRGNFWNNREKGSTLDD